jgi:hypothetical protein
MYPNYNIERLNRQKEEIEKIIKEYQQVQQPVNNFINTTQAPSKDLIEWRILNENEEVDNLYVQNKTLFINDNLMVLKGVDGSLEKWEVKKIYPIDKKDEKINQLEEEIKKLKEMMSNEHAKFNEPITECVEPNADDDGNVKPKPKTNGKPITK